MLFDLRGKRKRAIQVIYAALAVLMGGGLVLFGIGSNVQGGLFDAFSDNSGGGGVQFEDEAQKVEAKLKKDPQNEQLAARAVTAWYTAGNAGLETDPTTGQVTGISESAVQDFQKSGDAWQRYLKLAPAKPNPNTANIASKALLNSAAAGTTATEVSGVLDEAVKAQKIFTAARPSLGSYATLAQVAYLAGDTATAKEAGQKATQEAPKAQKAALTQALDQYQKQGQQVQKQIKAATKFKPGGQGKQALQSPLGGLSGGGSGLGAPAP